MRLITFTVILMAGFVTLTGCASSRSGSRGKLSEAMQKASDDYKGERKIEHQPMPRPPDSTYYCRCDSGHVYAVFRSTRDPNDLARVRTAYGKPWMGISVSQALLKSNDFYGLSSVFLSYEGFAYMRTRFDLTVGVAWAPQQQTSLLSKSIDGGITLLKGGIDVNFFITPPYTFMGNYLTLGCNFTDMSWYYRNPIIVLDEFGDEVKIEWDSIGGFDLYIGTGWNLAQTKYFILGGEVQPGAIFWGPYTQEDFENDVFPTFWYVRFVGTVKMRWW